MLHLIGWDKKLVKAFVVVATAVVLAATVACAASAAPVLHGVRYRGWHEVGGVHAARPQAHAAIVDGTAISIAQAPWQVAIFAFIEVEYEHQEIRLEELCGGAILNETEVLAAGHCMFNPVNGEQIPASDFLVVAGTSDYERPEPTEQVVGVANIQVHPYFSYAAGPGSPDDLAVVHLSSLLGLGGSTAQAIDLASAGLTLGQSTAVGLSGFGLQSPNAQGPSGELYALGLMVGPSEACGGEADAVFLCASAATGSACSGDSGSGLTVGGSTHTLVGILSTVEVQAGEPCREGAVNGFTNLAAPEIHDFIEGDLSPPAAPRGGEGLNIRGVPVAGKALTCSQGNWSGAPTFTYNFVEDASEQVLQSGSSQTYQLTTADIGRRIFCRLQAANAGGTAVESTGALRAIEAGPSSPALNPPADQSAPPANGEPSSSPSEAPEGALHGGVSLTDLTLAAISRDVVSAKLECAGDERCTGTLTLVAKAPHKGKAAGKSARTVLIGSARYSIAGDENAGVAIDLDATGRTLLSAARGRLEAQLTLHETAPTENSSSTHSVHLTRAKQIVEKRRKK
jgi:hypothetical protein